MTVLWKGIQVSLALFLIAGLLFASAVFGVLLFAKITGQTWFLEADGSGTIAYAEENPPAATVKPEQFATQSAQAAPVPPATAFPPNSVMLNAPLLRQLPELPSGCEVTSLAMLLQYYGVDKSKLDLAKELPLDQTPIRYNADGSIASWGNPNLGFVGDITGVSKGFGIYHTALFGLLKKYAASAADLTGKPFDQLEKQLQQGIPSIVWTTIDYNPPSNWVIWDTSIGPLRTTFMEHAVLLVGYDENNVYVNDPLSGRSRQKIDKALFASSWEAMGQQALSLGSAPNK